MFFFLALMHDLTRRNFINPTAAFPGTGPSQKALFGLTVGGRVPLHYQSTSSQLRLLSESMTITHKVHRILRTSSAKPCPIGKFTNSNNCRSRASLILRRESSQLHSKKEIGFDPSTVDIRLFHKDQADFLPPILFDSIPKSVAFVQIGHFSYFSLSRITLQYPCRLTDHRHVSAWNRPFILSCKQYKFHIVYLILDKMPRVHVRYP